MADRAFTAPHPCDHTHCGVCDRFGAWYRLTGNHDEAEAKARDLCVEQTVEFPLDLISDRFILEHVVGRLDTIQQGPENTWRALVTFANDDTGMELTQLLNVLFGNISLKPGIRVEYLKDCQNLWNKFKGPRFGREGLRDRLNAPGRAILATAVKPMGLPAPELADRAYHFAKGGIDIIKDDHGLANQPYALFEERVNRCTAAVAKANRETGLSCVYAPNVTAPADHLIRRAKFAKACGAGALLVSPGLAGFDAMRQLADDDSIDLPILAHPAFLGSFVTSPDNGLSHYMIFGQVMRLAGADVTIFPHAGGRFAFSENDCRAIAAATCVKMGNLKSIFPAPGGGMTLKRGDELKKFYGNDAVYLVGGDLFRNGPDIEKTCEVFRKMVAD